MSEPSVPTTSFTATTVRELAAAVARREVSATELASAALAAIDARDGALHAFVAVDADGALAQAAAIDRALARGEDAGALAGIPLAVKDLEDAAGFSTTHGSLAHVHDPPATRDSAQVERLRAAGCVVVGKTNTPELGWKADTVNEAFGATRHPRDPTRSAGGSSGGSAVAVAAGMVPLATGSDGGGSIRIPASVCGLPGFKPSLGRVPAGGPHPPPWIDLSTRGVMARTVADVGFVLDTVIGPDPTDLRSLPLPEASWTRSLAELHAPRRVAWSPTLGYAPVDAEVLAACESLVHALERAGTEVVLVTDVFADDPVVEWLAISASGCLRSMEPFRGTEMWERLDPGLVTEMEWAAGLTALDLVHALDAGHRLNVRLVELFHGVSLLLTPTVAGQTPRIGEAGTIDGRPDLNWVRFTYPFNLTRSPAGTVPAGVTADGMPVGLQVIGPQHADVAVLRLLALLEAL